VKVTLGDRADAEDLVPRTRMRMNMPDMDDMHDLPMPPMVMFNGAGPARLGVRTQALNKDLGSYFSIPDGKGVLVVEVIGGTPAEKAGIKAGDVITKVRDRSVYEPSDLVSALRNEDAGKVPLTVVRKGRTQTIQPELEKPESRTYMFRGGQGPMGMRHWSSDGDDRDQQIRDLQRQLDDLKREMQKLQHD
jgi:C-terminal processing protease CtpA/Prc